MRPLVCLIFMGLMQQVLYAQISNDAVVTRQCSAIRELVYAAATAKFEPIRGNQIRGSSGHLVNGNWQFTTFRYDVEIAWQGASKSYLEYSEESTDTSRQETWQYIAEYSHVPGVLEAQKLFTALNNEIEGCVYPLNDSVDVSFIPLPPNRLPAERPSSLEIAKLYELPFTDNNAATQGAIMVMVGMEKRAKDYRVSLIVENAIK